MLLVPGGSLGSRCVGEDGADGGGIMAIEGIGKGTAEVGRLECGHIPNAVFCSGTKSVCVETVIISRRVRAGVVSVGVDGGETPGVAGGLSGGSRV
jgi:hypothetical protein